MREQAGTLSTQPIRLAIVQLLPKVFDPVLECVGRGIGDLDHEHHPGVEHGDSEGRGELHVPGSGSLVQVEDGELFALVAGLGQKAPPDLDVFSLPLHRTLVNGVCENLVQALALHVHPGTKVKK